MKSKPTGSMGKKPQQGKAEDVSDIVLYRYMPWDAFEKTISSWSLKATLASDTNDYFEFFPATSKEPELDDFAKNYTRENGAFLCFTTKMSNCAMWGNYADHFKGVCMAFLFPRTEPLKKVLYQHERINVGDINNHNKGEVMHRLLSTKDITWKYENEYRIIYEVKDAAEARDGMLLYSEPMKYFTGVILGTRCPYSVEYVKAMIKLRAKKDDIGSPIVNNLDKAVTRSRAHSTKFRIIDNFWKDKMTGIKLRNKGYNIKPNHGRRYE